MKRVGLGILVVLGWLGPAVAQPRPMELPRRLEEIGSWIAGCPGKGGASCEVRHRSWLVAPAGARPFAALEIRGRHGATDPVVVVYGVTIPEAAGTVLALGAEATIRFGAEPPIRLSCDFADGMITCAPTRADAVAAAAQLRQAKVVTIRLHLAQTLPDLTRTLELFRTGDAADRIQPSGDGRWDLRDLLDWSARQLGFPGGTAELTRWLLKAP